MPLQVEHRGDRLGSVAPQRQRWGDQLRLPSVGGQRQATRQPPSSRVSRVLDTDRPGDLGDEKAEVLLPGWSPHLQFMLYADPAWPLVQLGVQASR